MTREEFRAMVREEVQSILKAELHTMLNGVLRVPEDKPWSYRDNGDWLGDWRYRDARRELVLHLPYFNSVEDSLQKLHDRIEDVEHHVDFVADAVWPDYPHKNTRPDRLAAIINKMKGKCSEDPNYEYQRLVNIDKAIEHFKDDAIGLGYWLHSWSMCPYPERPWSGEPYVDLGPDTPEINRPPTDPPPVDWLGFRQE